MQCSHRFRIALCTFIPLVCCCCTGATFTATATLGRQHPPCRHVWCRGARALWERDRIWIAGSLGAAAAASDRARIEERRDRGRRAWERSGRRAMVVVVVVVSTT